MKLHSISLWLVVFMISIEIQQAVYNGRRAVGNFFSYQVSLWIDCQYVCGGVVIDKWHILTAAHCIENITEERLIIFAGTKCLSRDRGSVHLVSHIDIHDDFEMVEESIPTQDGNITSTYVNNDIAILTLENSLSLGKNIKAAELPSRDIFCNTENLFCKFAGWGCNKLNSQEGCEHLLWTHMSLLSREECISLGAPITEHSFCTRDFFNRTTTLEGDSGSGLLCDGILVGIASSTQRDPYLPCTHRNVSHFLSFIYNITGRDRRFSNITNGEERVRIHLPCVCY